MYKRELLMRILSYFLVGITIVLFSHSYAQPVVSADLLQKPWNAQWITGPGVPINRWTASSDLTLEEFGVFKFRKTIELKEKPSSFVVNVSADNRYKLYVNGVLVAQGPAREICTSGILKLLTLQRIWLPVPTPLQQ